ncbi:MAG: DNA-protecting protein DprA [Chloroflexota bacterium]|nr:DNA-protecting protein DprA [Chloroflexota bacterium]
MVGTQTQHRAVTGLFSVNLSRSDSPQPAAPFDVTLLALTRVRGLGRAGIAAIADEFGDLGKVWFAQPARIHAALVRSKTPNAERIAADLVKATDELLQQGAEEVERLASQNVTVLHRSQLPNRLQGIPDAPRWLFVEGNVDALFGQPVVAIVGTREPTMDGMRAATVVTRIASAYPVTVVSGLAEGIDAVAHRVSLQEGVPNVAFLGHGVDVFFPAQTVAIRNAIVEANGAVATEYLPKERYQRQYFIDRNRLQAALADLVIPIQANTKGGTAHTVRFARRYERLILGIRWNGANGILTDLERNDVPIADIAAPEGQRYVDMVIRNLADRAGKETFGLARVERLLLSELRQRNIRDEDVAQLFEVLAHLRESDQHGKSN